MKKGSSRKEKMKPETFSLPSCSFPETVNALSESASGVFRLSLSPAFSFPSCFRFRRQEKDRSIPLLSLSLPRSLSFSLPRSFFSARSLAPRTPEKERERLNSRLCLSVIAVIPRANRLQKNKLDSFIGKRKRVLLKSTRET